MPRKVGGVRGRPVKVNLSPLLARLVDEVIEDGVLGYSSRDEFVADAVRRRLEELGYIKVREGRA